LVNANLFLIITGLSILWVIAIPIPKSMLDFLLVFNLTLSLLVVLLSIFLTRATDFLVFPVLLLLLTIFRLALNIASTRMILLETRAPDVILALGQLMSRNNLLIGLILFLALMVGQHVVVVDGCQRIAEVKARFALDSLPGRMMAIDSDQSLDKRNKEQSRQHLQREVDFYSSMDGAVKYVKGDATVGLISVSVNLIGGIFVGIALQQMTILDAVNRYTILTIGDGLMTRISALLLMVASSLLSSRVRNTN